MDIENIVCNTARYTGQIPRLCLVGKHGRLAARELLLARRAGSLLGACRTVFTVMTLRIQRSVFVTVLGEITTAASYRGLGVVQPQGVGVRDVRSYQDAWA